MRVSFLGTGLMGLPMAQRLQRAHVDLAVWNRTRAKTAPLAALGARVAETPADAAVDASLICLCLRDADAVEQALFGSEGAIHRMTSDALVIDFSTIGVAPTHSFSDRLRALHPRSKWLDAPVTGGVSAAERGTLIIFCGGDAEDVERASPVLAAVGKRHTRLGPVGSGQATKLCNQLIVSANLIAIAEAIALAETLGVDAGRLPSALGDGFADSVPLQIFGPRMAARVHEAPLATISMMLKDVDAICAATGPLRLPLTDATRAIYETAVAQGRGDHDVSALIAGIVHDRAPS